MSAVEDDYLEYDSYSRSQQFKLQYKTDSSVHYYSHEDKVVVVNVPRSVPEAIKDEFYTRVQNRTPQNCCAIMYWEEGKVPFFMISTHLRKIHPGIRQVKA